MKKICIVVPNHISAKIGGAQYQAELIAQALYETGEYFVYVLTRWSAPGFSSSAYQLVNFSNGLTRRGRFLMDLPGLYRALKRIGPDIIYQRVGCTFTGLVAYYSERHPCTSVWHVASDRDVNSGLNVHHAGILHRIERKIFEYGLRNVDRVVVQTYDQARMLQENYGRKADGLVRNFHPLPETPVSKPQVKYVVWIGNLKKLKCPDLFIGLAEALADMDGVRFIMIGLPANDAAWQEQMEGRIGRAGNLDYVGPKTAAEVHSYLEDAALLVNTSIWEGFSNTFIEAWMRCVPVITLDVNPDNLLYEHGIGECTKNVDSLVRTVRSYLLDNNLRAESARKARRFAEENHSMKNADRLMEIFESAA